MKSQGLAANVLFYSAEASYCHLDWLKQTGRLSSKQKIEPDFIGMLRASPVLSTYLRQRFMLPSPRSWPETDIDQALIHASSAELMRLSNRVGAIIYFQQIRKTLDRRDLLPLYASIGKDNIRFALKNGPFIVSAKFEPPPINQIPLEKAIRIVGVVCLFSAAEQDAGFQARLTLKLSSYLARRLKKNRNKPFLDRDLAKDIVSRVLLHGRTN